MMKTPSRHPISAASFLAQSEAAERMVKKMHDRLIEMGFVWDGIIGYEAPPGMTLLQVMDAMSRIRATDD